MPARKPADKTTQLLEALQDAEGAVRRLRLEYEAEKNRVAYPEPQGQGAIVRFMLKHLEDGRQTNHKVYFYAAVRVEGRWFTTGSTCPPLGYSWEGLWRFIAHNQLINYEVMVSQDVPF